jgi:hypothetical protein
MSIVDAVQMKASTTASPAARDSTLGLGEAIFCRKKHDSNSKFEGSFATRWLVVQPKDYARGAGSRSFMDAPVTSYRIALLCTTLNFIMVARNLVANKRSPLTILLISFSRDMAMFTLASRSSNVPIVAEGLTHAKNTSTWVAFCMASLQLITPLATQEEASSTTRMPCSEGSMPRPDHHQWRRMSILELIIPIRWHGSSLTRASWLWGFPDKSGARHGTDPRSAFASPHEILVGDLRG